MIKPPYKIGGWRVMRWCCHSGLCIECHSRGNHGDKSKRTRVVHTYGVTEEWARYVAQNWNELEATAELMKGNEE